MSIKAESTDWSAVFCLPQRTLGYSALLLITCHALVYGWRKWAEPKHFLWYTPPSFILASLLPGAVLLAKGVLLLPCVDRKLARIRRGWERPRLLPRPLPPGEKGPAERVEP